MAKAPKVLPPPPPPVEAEVSPRLELLVGFGALLLFLLATDLGTLLRGHVNSFGAVMPAEKGLRNIYEMIYQMPPMLKTGAEIIRSGIFPAWTPFSEGGTPLMGKMLNGVFSPLHIPLYVLPMSWFPYILTLLVILRSCLAYGATYLFGRKIGLSPWTAAAAGVLFAAVRMLDGLFASGPGSALLPLALYLIERYAQGERRLSPWLLPWAIALPFFAGHFEIALRNGATAVVYAFLRLRATEPAGKRLAAAWPLAIAAALGGAIASFQAYAGQEYLASSYNHVWRTLPEFGWRLRTCLKPLHIADLFALGLGWASAGAGFWLIRRPGPLRLAGVPFVAAALALLGLVGLDDPMHSIGRLKYEDLPGLIVGPATLALAGWAAWRAGAHPGQRALGWIAALSAAVVIKLPPLSTLLVSLPIVGLLNNSIYLPELELARILLAAGALEAGLALARRPWIERRAAVLAPLAVTLSLAAAVGLAPHARRWLTPLIETYAESPGVPPENGGFQTPKKISTFGRTLAFTGWVKGGIPASAMLVGIKGDQAAGTSETVKEIARDGWRFNGTLKLEEGVERVGLQIRYPDGKGGVLHGPAIELLTMPRGGAYLAAASFALAVGLPALGTLGPIAGIAGMTLLALRFQPLSTVPAADFPFQSPGIEKVLEDKGLYRVGSLTQGFISADYPAVYGLQDSRNGGDNLDPLSNIYFQFFLRGQLENKDPKARRLGLEMLSLENVKYLLEPPESDLKDAGLECIYKGPEMTVYRNHKALPRAVFFERAANVPIGDLKDWRNQNRVFGPLAGITQQADFKFDRDLVLHDAPYAPNSTSGPSKSAQPQVRMLHYRADSVSVEVDTPRQGFLFLSDNLLPGWTARVNDEARPILRSWVTYRAVAVPAGLSRVDFEYHPLGLFGLAFMSFGAAWAWALALLTLAPWRRLPEPAAPAKKGAAPAPPPPACWKGGEILLAALVAADLLFWSLWAATCLGGGLSAGLRDPGALLLVNAAAAFALFLGAILLWRLRRAATSSVSPLPLAGEG